MKLDRVSRRHGVLRRLGIEPTGVTVVPGLVIATELRFSVRLAGRAT
jgi:hypothetical protein